MSDILGNVENVITEVETLLKEGVTELEQLFGIGTAVVVPPVPPVVTPDPTPTPPIVVPDPNPPQNNIWLLKNSWPTQAQAPAFYGNPSLSGWAKANLVVVPCPWTLHMDKTVVHGIQIHHKVAESLHRVLQFIWEKAGKSQEAIEKLHYDRYSGSYNYRPIRGGHGLSMHSYGVAIDFDDQENQQHSEHHLFQPDSLIVQAFEGEGWIWGGRWQKESIDAMHFQACRVR